MHFYLVCNMNKIGAVFVIYLLFVATGAAEIKSSQTSRRAEEANKSKETFTRATVPSYVSARASASHGVGVASIAGVDSRNGRLSSISGIKFFPPIGSSIINTDNKGYYNFKSVSDKRTAPITKQGDGVSGNIRFMPGSISVSSSAISGGKAEQASRPKESPTKTASPRYASAYASAGPGMGVASIAGFDSRNGRLSSINGINFFSPIDSSMIKTDNNGKYIFKSNGNKMPLTITKQGDGSSGTIQIMPGSVSVASSAKSGSASASAGPQISDFNFWSSPFMKPMIDDDIFFSDPFPAFPSISNSAYHTRISDPVHRNIPEPSFPRLSHSFSSRTQDPWFQDPWMQDPWIEHDKIFKRTLAEHNDMMSPSWQYPNFSPFINYW